jgi:hypothetical protein
MSAIKPDFYLASTEGYDLEEPRCCFKIKRLRGSKRDDLLLIKIAPPIIGQKYGLGAANISHDVIATRFKEDSLFPISQWPVYVHVARLMFDFSEIEETVSDKQLKEIAWAELYPTEEAARAKKII